MLQQSAGHSLDQVVTAFSEKVAELRELILLRTDSELCNSCHDLFASCQCNMSEWTCCHTGAASDLESSELAQLDSSIQVAESKLQGIQRCISQEKQAISQAKVLITACAAQSDQLQYIESHLPARLPEASALSSQQPLGASVSAEDRPTDSVPNTNENVDSTNLEVQPVPAKQLAGDKKKRAKAPRRYVLPAKPGRYPTWSMAFVFAAQGAPELKPSSHAAGCHICSFTYAGTATTIATCV